MSSPRLYVVTRRDLPVGLATAQACHVVRRFTKEHPELPCPDDENLIVLAAASEPALRELGVLLAWETPLSYRSEFHEPDLKGEEPGGQLTAIAVEGSRTTETALLVRRLLSSLPKFREPQPEQNGLVPSRVLPVTSRPIANTY